MKSDCGQHPNQNPKLSLKNSEIHVERLKKLKQKLSFQTPHISQYNSSKRQTFLNSKFSLPQSTSNNFNPLDQSFKKQENPVPNKSNYFQNINLKNIQSQNQILYKKIQTIFKRKPTNHIFQSKNPPRKSNTTFQNQDEPPENDAPHVTSDLAEEMIKNRATRSMIKQQQIRNQNLKMLQRLMSLKPTIETKKILNQTRKQKQISKRMSKFNSFHSIQFQKDEEQKGSTGELMNFKFKRFSVDNKSHDKIESDYEIPLSSAKKQRLSSYHERTYRLMPQNTSILRRTNTQPIQSVENMKLPTLSPNKTMNIHLFNSKEKPREEMKRRAQSQNLKYYETSKNFSRQKTSFQATSFDNRSNSTHKVAENDENANKNLFKAKKALEKQKVLSDNQLRKVSPKKFILLGEIEKKVQTLNVRFRFLRFSSYYEIQMREKKQVKKDKKVEKAQQSSKQYILSRKFKAPNPLNRNPATSSQNLGIKMIQNRKQPTSQTSHMKLKFQGGVISLNEQMGSALFSSFDYDYDQIIEKCLSFGVGKDNVLNIEMKEDFREFSKRSISFQHDSIRQNDQDEEEDSSDSVRQQ